MTKQLEPGRVRQITEKLAQLYVDDEAGRASAWYEAVAGEPLTRTQVFKLKDRALGEFNQWLEQQGSHNGPQP